MGHSNDLQKVVDTVITAISVQGGTVPFMKSDGSVGEFTDADNKETVYQELMKWLRW